MNLFYDDFYRCKKCKKIDCELKNKNIDKDIIDILCVLNNKGYKTLFSCSGHLKKPSFYIYFDQDYGFKSVPYPCFIDSGENNKCYILRQGIYNEDFNEVECYSYKEWYDWKKESVEDRQKILEELWKNVYLWALSLPKLQIKKLQK